MVTMLIQYGGVVFVLFMIERGIDILISRDCNNEWLFIFIQ